MSKETLMINVQIATTRKEAAETRAVIALFSMLGFMLAFAAEWTVVGWEIAFLSMFGLCSSMYYLVSERTISYKQLKEIERLESQIKALNV